MATKVLLKKSSVADKVPATSDLEYGELALNYSDGKLYFKNSQNTIQNFSSQLELNSLTDVDISTIPNNGEVLVYNSSSNKWIPGTVAGEGLYTNNATLTTTVADQILDSFDITQYRTVKYLIQIISGAEVESIEINLMHTDVGVLISQYNRMTSGTELGSFSASIDSTNAYLRFSPVNADTTIDLTRISIVARNLSGEVFWGDLMLKSGSEDLMLGSGTVDLFV
jgi:superfamily I DNA and/or RNA helicase